MLDLFMDLSEAVLQNVQFMFMSVTAIAPGQRIENAFVPLIPGIGLVFHALDGSLASGAIEAHLAMSRETFFAGRPFHWQRRLAHLGRQAGIQNESADNGNNHGSPEARQEA